MEVECDAEIIMKELMEPQGIQGCHLLSNEIKQLINKDLHVRIRHIYRKANICADKHADLSWHLEEDHMLKYPHFHPS